MTRYFHKNWILLAPLGLAFILKKAHDEVAFFPVFVSTSLLFLIPPIHWRLRPIPLKLILPFGLFFIWCWGGLLMQPPLDGFLFLYGRILLYLLAAISIFQYADETTSLNFEKIIVAIGSFETLVILLSLKINSLPYLQGYLGNHLHSGILLPAAFGVVLSLIQKEKQARFLVYGWAMLALSMAVSILLIRSRSAILSMAIIALFLYPRKSLWILTTLAALGLGLSFFIPEFLPFLFKIDTANLSISLDRFSIWSTALDAIQARPTFGYGLGNFERAYQMFQHPSHEFLRYGQSTIFAHNGFLQVATETGIPGALLLFIGFVFLFKETSQIISKQRALFSILIVFMVTSLFNYSLFHPFNGLLFSLTIGLLTAKANPSSHCKKKFNSLQSGSALLLPIIVMTLFLSSYATSGVFQKIGRLELASRFCPIRAETWYERAVQKLNRSEDGLPYIDRALIWDKKNSFYWQRRALALIKYYPQNVAEIDRSFNQSESFSPNHAPFYINRGFYCLKERHLQKAADLFLRASRLEPAAPLPHLGLALAYELLGDRNQMIAELKLVHLLKNLHSEDMGSDYGRFLFKVNENISQENPGPRNS